MNTLKTEYIVVVKKSSPFCNSIKTFNSLLAANADIEVKASKLIHKDIEVDYEIHLSELDDKDLRFFHLKFICHQLQKIDEFEELLKAVRTIAYKTDGHVKILWDDIAYLYSIKSYPLVNEIENLMRRLIIQFMLTTVGVDWDKEALPKDLKENIKKKKNSDNATTSILHETDFIQLADCLFKPYFTKEVDLLYKQLEKAYDVSELKIDELKEFIPKSNWTRYFSLLVDCDDSFLNKRWLELYDLRCLVAHNNLLRKSDYERIVVLISEIKPKLQKAIDNLDKVTVPEQEKDNLAENVVVNINSLYGEFIILWRVVESELERLFVPIASDSPKILYPPTMMLGPLTSTKVLDQELAEQIKFLSRLRNSIVHGKRDIPDDEIIGDIYQNIGLIKDVAGKLKAL